MDNKQKNIPAIVAIIIVSAFIILIAVGVLIGVFQRDPKGAAEDLLKLFSVEHVTNYEMNGDSILKVYVDAEYCERYNEAQISEYCDRMHLAITAILWNHKVVKSPNVPDVTFYTSEGSLLGRRNK